MAIKLPSHLHRSRSGTLHFRIAIPADLRHHFPSREIYRSTRTACVRDATETAQSFSLAFRRAFREIRQQSMVDDDDKKYSPQTAKLMEMMKMKKMQLKYQGIIESLESEIEQLQIKSHKQHRQHERELGLILQAGTIAGAGPQPTTPLASSSPKFSDVVADFVRTKRAQGKWTEKTQEDYEAVYKLFVRIVGDRPIADIDDTMILTYLETLQKLPPNLNKLPALVGKTIEQILALDLPPMAARSVNKNVERVSSVFKWALGKSKYGLTRNPAVGMSVNEADATKRQPFSAQELVSLFGGNEFQTRKFDNPYAYWLMPLGLLTGARLGELCQLYLKDFVEHNGVPCIEISDEEEGQRVKNQNAKRLVPIHDKLIELGLLRYVDDLRAAGEERLFPELSQRRDGFAHAASNWFQRYKKRCGIEGKHTKVFHSFRHTFISALLDDDVPEHAVAQIVGHEAQLITGRVYWNARDAAKRKPTVDRYQPPFDAWALLPRYEDVVTETWPSRIN